MEGEQIERRNFGDHGLSQQCRRGGPRTKGRKAEEVEAASYPYEALSGEGTRISISDTPILAQGVTGEPRTALASHPVLLEPRTDSGYERTGGGATCCSRFSDSSG